MSTLFYCGVNAFNSIVPQKICKVPMKVDENIAGVKSTLDLFVYSKLSSMYTWFVKGFGMTCPSVIFTENLQIDQVEIVKSTVYGLSTLQNRLCQVILNFNETGDVISQTFSDVTQRLSSCTAKLLQIAANETTLFVIDRESGIYKYPELLFRCEKIKIAKVTCGFDHTLILSDTGAVYSFGNGSRGQLGHPDILLRCEKPIRIEFFDDLPCIITDVACGGWHSLALTSDGDVYSFGWNTMGQLGHSSERLSTVVKDPYPLDLGSRDNPIVAICAGARHSHALLKNGDLYGWGWNKYGQLGIGDNTNRSVPSLITHFVTEKPFKIVAGGWGSFIYVNPKFDI